MTNKKISMLELTKKLVSYKSTPYNELELAQYISNLLNKNKIPHTLDEFVTLNSNKTANVYVEVGKGNETIILYFHIDVVAGKEELFNPILKNEKLYGRGTSDMKTALAGLINVLIEDYEKLKNLNKKILFTFIADEETTATGIRRFVEWQKNKDYNIQLAVLMEPTKDFEFITVGQKGYASIELNGNMQDILETLKNIKSNKQKILEKYPDVNDGFGSATLEITKVSAQYKKEMLTETIIGKACHSSGPYLGINAVEKALESHPDITYLKSSETEGPNSLSSKASYSIEKLSENIDTKANINLRFNIKASENKNLLNDVISLISPLVKTEILDIGSAFILKEKSLVNICKKNMPFETKEQISLAGSDAPYLLDITPNVIAGFGPGLSEVVHSDEEYVSLKNLELTPIIIRQIINNFENYKEK